MQDVGDGRSVPSEEAATPITTPGPNLAIHRAGIAVVVAVHGELEGGMADVLCHILWDLICDQGNLHVAIDLGAVSAADTNGVAVLVDGCRLAREHDATLALVNAPLAIEQALDRWRDAGMVTEDEAVAFCSRSTAGTSDRQPGPIAQLQGPFDQATLMEPLSVAGVAGTR